MEIWKRCNKCFFNSIFLASLVPPLKWCQTKALSIQWHCISKNGYYVMWSQTPFMVVHVLLCESWNLTDFVSLLANMGRKCLKERVIFVPKFEGNSCLFCKIVIKETWTSFCAECQIWSQKVICETRHSTYQWFVFTHKTNILSHI